LHKKQRKLIELKRDSLNEKPFFYSLLHGQRHDL
jgi:hypothetical protein